MATGYVQAVNGGGANIVVSQTSAPGKVSIFSSGSALDGFPLVYGAAPYSPDYYQVGFTNLLTVVPFINGKGGYVSVSSNAYGADVFVSGVVGTNCIVKRYSVKPGTTQVKSLKPGGKAFTLLNYNEATVYVKASKRGKAFPLGGY